MTRKPEAERRAEIEAVAVRLLAETGPQGLSMLAVARAARASNQTLYRWYGSKEGLFAALVQRQADLALSALDAVQEDAGDDPLEGVLTRLGPVLLESVLADTPVALTRAAVADPGGGLAEAVQARGRQALVARLAAILDAAGVARPGVAADLYLALLLGDAQMRRALGLLDMPGPEKALARAAFAARAFLDLLERD